MSPRGRATGPLPAGGRPAPASYPKQVDPTTCGIATLAVLAARADADPAYLGEDRDSVVRTQKELHAIAARVGAPWPQALGTSPWSLARLARVATGLRHRIVLRGKDLRPRIDAALARGRDVLVYTGGSKIPLSGLVPRHVVLLLAHAAPDGRYAIFEPSSGRVFRVDPDDFYAGAEAARPALGHWDRVLLAVIPDAPSD
ncbi:hypothetical protein [Actinomyces culturomici]|uniref:hypothetical protein n=1 Tax=Actinomyces culturomici TaxID=1926276 RepID=UPI000E20178E|nr:hypothetical protein [Actinomyces culturomici]